MSTRSKKPDPLAGLAPKLGYIRHLPEAGSRVRGYAEREAEIIARVQRAINAGITELGDIRHDAAADVSARWTRDEIAEAQAATAAESVAEK